MELSKVAKTVSGNVCRDAEFLSLGYLGQSTPKLLTFLESEIFLSGFLKTPSSSVITTEELKDKVPPDLGCLVVDNPRSAFYLLHDHLLQNTNFYGGRNSTSIALSAQISSQAVISSVGVTIGENSIIEAGVTVSGGVTIGRNVIIRSGSIIGGEGFEFKRSPIELRRIPHAGGVVIEDDVEIQHGVTVDRAVFSSSTTIGAGSKIDNLVHVAHNVIIGRHCLLAAGCIISGSVQIEDEVWIGPNAVISSGLKIGKGAFVAIGSSVVRNVPSGKRAYGKGLGCNYM
jgi:UDP-3-O-[3-hydroxymyristoyl] glucosamine N-acyltransferase